MGGLSRKKAKGMIKVYLGQHPNATSSEIGKALGVSKQRAYMLLKLLGIKGLSQLTGHELTVLRLIAKGDSNRQIAKRLNIAEQTVKNEVTLILAKLNATNRAHAVTLAMHKGLISLDELKPAKTASK